MKLCIRCNKMIDNETLPDCNGSYMDYLFDTYRGLPKEEIVIQLRNIGIDKLMSNDFAIQVTTCKPLTHIFEDALT